VLRGDVYELRPPWGSGHEQQGRRLGVVVQSDAFLPRSVVIVAPTSRSARAASFRPEIEIAGEATRVLVEQLGAVDSGRLGACVGHLAREELWGVDESLRLVLALR
jgi:mRNA interferase MazF